VTPAVPWQPWIDGDLAARALEAVQAIAGELLQGPGWLPDGVSDESAGALRASLASGRAGQALFFAYLALAGRGEACSDRALALLDEATDAVAAIPMTGSLYSGFPGVAWVTDHLRGRLFLDDEAGDAASEEAEVDNALLGALDGAPGRGEYDLINGLTGIGVYALEGAPRLSAAACLERVIERLAERATDSPQGAAWFSPPERLPAFQRADYPGGLFNLGVSHGGAGVVGLLGAACRAGQTATAGSLLERATVWLLARRQEPGAGFCFPHFHAPGVAPRPSRLAWCYGDAGMAAALWIAARAAGEPAWERAAREVALAAAARSPESARVQDAGLCHGAAGLAHVFGRLAWEMGDERLAVAARLWLERALAFRSPGRGAGGFRSWAAGLSGVQDWRDDRGFLEGAAGVGLALLGATSSVASMPSGSTPRTSATRSAARRRNSDPKQAACSPTAAATPSGPSRSTARERDPISLPFITPRPGPDGRAQRRRCNLEDVLRCPSVCRTLSPMAGRTSSKRAPARPRSERLEARISSEQKALFQRAAELQGRTLTDFVLASVHESAVKAIAELEAIRLTAADSRAFAEVLLHPREPVPELRVAAERYRKMVGGGSDREREPALSDRST